MAILLFLLALLAFSLSAVTGGGAGLLLLPVLRIVLPGAQVPAALTLGTASSSVSRLLAFWRSVEWRIVAWFVPASLPFAWLGAWLLASVNPLYVETLVGLFLVANLPAVFRQPQGKPQARPLPGIALALIGAAAGLVSGLTGAVGLLFNRFYLRYGLSKEQIVATRAANELLLHLVKLVLYAAFGLLTGQALTYGGLVALAAILASWLMKGLLPRLPEAWFRRVGYGAMVVSGLAMLTSATGRLSEAKGLQMAYAPLATGAEAKLAWKGGGVALEFEYDEGIEYEREIALAELPPDKQVQARALITGAERYRIEEVFGIGDHGYEVYVSQAGVVRQVEL